MEIFSFIFSIDEHLFNIVAMFGNWTYVILFGVIFAETGLVVTPFLPGDSLLFAVGAMAGADRLNIWVVYIILMVAAILGDTVNYWIGHHMGQRVFYKEDSRLFNKAYLEKTKMFYEKHGGKTIILARFVPIIRTFAPFIAGIGKMDYKTFAFYNITGAFVWVTVITFAGYFFGSLPFVQEHFESVIIGIILISLLPIVIEYFKRDKNK